jgi:hypothetical protein
MIEYYTALVGLMTAPYVVAAVLGKQKHLRDSKTQATVKSKGEISYARSTDQVVRSGSTTH